MSDKKRVLVIGSGGREHAIVKACLNSPLASSVIAAPGNGGMAQEVDCFPVDVESPSSMVALAKAQGVEFVVVGPEVPLCCGAVDALAEAGIEAYGPNEKAAKFEGSKAYTKDFLKKYNIPTAAYENFTVLDKALTYLNTLSEPPVIKASGLAAGKGVLIADTMKGAEAAIRSMLEEKVFGESGSSIVVEELLKGKEVSLHVMISGEDYMILPLSRDHKRIGENDTGLNTGGMGAFAPTDDISSNDLEIIKETVIEPTIKGMISDDIDFRGTLFIGLMIDGDDIKVLEFNVRFGDPETQVLLPLLDEDILAIMMACSRGEKIAQTPKLKSGATAIVVLAAEGYPDSYPKGDVITFPENISSDQSIIHAGTKREANGDITTNGGRVLGVCAYTSDLKSALDEAYRLCEQVDYKTKYYRRDIGK